MLKLIRGNNRKRDKKGRFIKGFSDKTDAQLNDEYDNRLQEEQEKQSYYIDAANEESIYNEMIAPIINTQI